jgi:hypothetical protein
LKDRFRGRPLAGVLLFTDGVATDAKRVEFKPDDLPPVYPVIMGLDSLNQTLADLAVSHLTITTTAFEDAPVTIQADVTQTSLPKAKVTAQVLDEAGNVVKEETQSFSGDQSPIPFRFQIRPTKPGLSFYEVRVRMSDETKRHELKGSDASRKTGVITPIIDPSSVESTLANNRRLVAIDRGSAKYRILYLCGRPNWEYKLN